MLTKNSPFLFISLFFLIFACEKKQPVKKAMPKERILELVKPKDDSIQKMKLGIQQPEWAKNAVIYEVNIRQFSPKGNFKGVIAELNRIKDLGIDVIWLMPIHPIGKKNRKGKLGSYYAVKDFKGINPEFGKKEDFKTLVDSAHSLGMKVIMDWVANHSSPDNIWAKNNPEFYFIDSLSNLPIPNKEWTDVTDLNYQNPALRDSMTAAMKYWVQNFNIDGFRCDMAELVPLDFWENTRRELEQIKPLFLIAESQNPKMHQVFNATYAWAFKDSIVEIAQNQKSFKSLTEYILEKKKKFKPNDLRLYFTTNHDENSWNYIEKDLMGKNRYNYVVLTYMMGGIPLIYNGQESGLNKKIKFFEKDSIDWKDYAYAQEYRKLNQLYKQHSVLWNNGTDESYEILEETQESFRFIKTNNNQMIAVLQNYSDKPQWIRKISVNTFNLNQNILTGKPLKMNDQAIEILPHSTILLIQ